MLERELSISLPEPYKTALRVYPFSPGSVGQEMLVSDVAWLLKRNKNRLPGLPQGLFLIGTNGSELQYYLRIDAGTTAVMEYDLESKRLTEFAASFDQYLETIRRLDARIDAEEALGEERARAIPGWRHHLHFYTPAAIGLLLFFVVMPLLAFGIWSLYQWMAK